MKLKVIVPKDLILDPQKLARAVANGLEGAVYYKGKILTAFLSDTDMQEITIPLKSTPDGFDAKQERDNA